MGSASSNKNILHKATMPLWGLLLFFLMLFFSYFRAPTLNTLHDYQVNPEHLTFMTTSTEGNHNIITQAGTAFPFDEQWSAQENARYPRQFSFETSIDAGNLQPDSDELAFYAPSVSGRAILYLNNIAIAESENVRMSAPGYGKQALYAPLPKIYFQPGVNIISLLQLDEGSGAGLKTMYLGDAAVLGKAWEAHHKWHLEQYYLLLFLSILLALGALLILFSQRKRAEGLLILGLSAVLLLECGIFVRASVPFINQIAILYVAHITIFKLGLLAGLFLLFLRENSNPNSIKLLLIILNLFAGLYVLSPIILHPIEMDFTAHTLALFWPLPFGLYWISHHIWTQLQQELSEAAEMRAEMREKDEALKKAEFDLQEQIRKSAVLEERQRLTRDMHDGIGGQLLSLLVRVRGGKLAMADVEREIQGGINDLRLIVDSMDSQGDNLEAALATFRSRARAQLDAAGIELDWQQSEALHWPNIGTREVLNLYRLLQEAVTNTMRHSGAKMLGIRINQNLDDGLNIMVSDDGVGIDENSNLSGKGLKNMRLRAEKLGGTLRMGPGIDGRGLGIEISIRALPFI